VVQAAAQSQSRVLIAVVLVKFAVFVKACSARWLRQARVVVVAAWVKLS
jgi:hypothetical protein